MDPPIHNPGVPYTGYISGGFGSGRSARIQGRISPSASRFAINLQSGSSSNDEVALHFNPRFGENAVVRNARGYSGWGAEERHQRHFPFVPGQHFEVMILSEASRYMIAVNGEHFAEFNHRVPAEQVNHLVVEGDVTLTLIQFDGTPTPSYGASAPQLTAAPPYPTSNAPYPPMGFSAPVGGAPLYPAASGPGYPPAASPYPSAGGPGYPAPPMSAGYPPSGPPPPAYAASSPYPHSPGAPPPAYAPNSAYPSQPGYASGPGPYPAAGYPQGGYPPQGHQKGGILGNAGKLIGAGLAGAGLAGVANKIGIGSPGHGPGHHGPAGHGYGHGMAPNYGPGGHAPGHGSGGGILGGVLGSAAALGAGGLVANKVLGKKHKKHNKMLKYGLPLAGVGVGGYALSKGLKHGHKGFGHGSSSSSSSSSEEE